MTALRHLAAILILPFTVVVLVPRWLLHGYAARDTRWPAASGWPIAGRVAGLLLFAAGLGLFAWCVALFARHGRGTLAPWDPTRRLVALGPYRYVRNPMISGVAAMLAGEAAYTGSTALAVWLAAFASINHVYFMVVEEPGLVRRFGAEYEAYRAAVPRWIPRRPGPRVSS